VGGGVKMKRGLDAAVSAYLRAEDGLRARVSVLVARAGVLARRTAQALARAMGIWL
jgi:hypothetical protein